MDLFTRILTYIFNALKGTCIQLLILLGPATLLAIGMYHITVLIQRLAMRLIGFKAWLVLFKSIGTPIHELGHAFFCLIFGHKIESIELFHPLPDGGLGSISHRYNPRNIYHQIGNFFIGIAPILFGTLLVALLAAALLGGRVFSPIQALGSQGATIAKGFTTELFARAGATMALFFNRQNFSSWQIYVFILLAFQVGHSITLSPADIRGAAKGFLYFVLLILVINLASLWSGDFLDRALLWLLPFLVMLLFTMVLVLLISAVIAILLLVLTKVLHRK